MCDSLAFVNALKELINPSCLERIALQDAASSAWTTLTATNGGYRLAPYNLPVYVLHAPSPTRRSRRPAMIARLIRAGVRKATLVLCANKDDVASFHTDQRRCLYQPTTSLTEGRTSRQLLTNSTLSLVLKHRIAYWDILQQGHAGGLVLEDDAYVAPTLFDQVGAFAVPVDADIFYLGSYQALTNWNVLRWDTRVPGSTPAIYRRNCTSYGHVHGKSRHLGSVAYVVFGRAAREMLRRVRLPADAELSSMPCAANCTHCPATHNQYGPANWLVWPDRTVLSGGSAHREQSQWQLPSGGQPSLPIALLAAQTAKSPQQLLARPSLNVHPPFDEEPPDWTRSRSSCTGLKLTRVAVATPIQPIWHGSSSASLKRLLKPCRRTCTIGQAGGCIIEQRMVIGKCNATHGVEYAHRLPHPGEPAIVSFNMPREQHVVAALKAIARARPRIYFEYESSVHARVPRDAILRGVDGLMSFQRDSLIPYPYSSASQLWAATLRRPERGFHERRPAIAAFVSNCHSTHRNDAVDFLQRRGIDVHSYGACFRSHSDATANTSSSSFDPQQFRKSQGFESGVKPDCLHYRAILAIENSPCVDYVTEKLIQAVGCGAVPIVRTANGIPDYVGLFGRFPMLDAVRLDDAFASAVSAVITDEHTFQSYLPWYNPQLTPPDDELARREVRNPHCTLIDVVQRGAPYAPLAPPLPTTSPANGAFPSCEAGYRLRTPRPAQRVASKHTAE